MKKISTTQVEIFMIAVVFIFITGSIIFFGVEQ